MQTVLVVAASRDLGALVPLIRLRLLRGRHIDGRDQVIAAARLERRRALVLVIATASGAGAAEDQVVRDDRVATSRRLRRVVGV